MSYGRPARWRCGRAWLIRDPSDPLDGRGITGFEESEGVFSDHLQAGKIMRVGNMVAPKYSLGGVDVEYLGLICVRN